MNHQSKMNPQSSENYVDDRDDFLEKREKARKRGGGEGSFDWDSDSRPKEKRFETEEAFREAYRQWKRHVKRRAGIEVEKWPRLVNVSTVVEMFKEAFGVSRSTFYRRFRETIEFDARPYSGKKVARRDEVIRGILIWEDVMRDASDNEARVGL